MIGHPKKDRKEDLTVEKQTNKRAKKMDALNILRRAQEALKREGWTRNKLQSKDGRLCSIGAIYHATGELDDVDFKYRMSVYGSRRQAEFLLEEAILENFQGGNSISEFNDKPGRKKSEVLKAFSKAITKARKQQKGAGK